ncbi:MAG: translocase [Acidobacteria bacterium]|nr:MAG: translocase [Acidobacteriota bacterium]
MDTNESRGWADRLLRIFADVRAGEGVTALLLALNVFLILESYYVLKTVRESLILGQGSAELKSYLAAGQVVVLAIVVPLYARLVARFARQRLITVVSLFFVGCLCLFYVLGRAGVPLAVPYFVWIGIYSLMIIAQFWAFANDIYKKDEGERLFPIVGFGASLGAVVGSTWAARLIQRVGVYELMLIGAVLLFLAMLLTNVINRRVRREEATENRPNAAVGEEVIGSSGANPFAVVFRTRYLLLMGIMLLLLNWVNATGEYILGAVVTDRISESVAAGQAGGATVETLIGRAYARYFAAVNIVGLLLQLFVVSRVVKYLGVKIAIGILPCISLVSYNVLAFFPLLAVVFSAKVAENSVDYSLNNTVRNMLFLPCTREQKYSAKQVIDSFFVRLGDVFAALLVFVGTTWLALGTRGFAIANVCLVVVWIAVAIAIGRHYQELVTTKQPPTSKPARRQEVASGK